MISLTSPARMTITIPSFTAWWILAIGENAEVDYNEQFVKDILPYAEKGLNALLKQENENGLALFTAPYAWNFHEWSEGLDGGEIWRNISVEGKNDCCLTAITAIAAKKLSLLFESLRAFEKAKIYSEAADRLTKALEGYYDKEKGCYASYIKNGERQGYHEYTQALVLFAGGVPQERIDKLCKALKEPLVYELVPATFSVLQIKYDVLIKYGNEIEFCLQEVEKIFGGMLLQGATSFWETANGEADFDGSGSLCHGWSSVCCWVLDKYMENSLKVTREQGQSLVIP